MARIEAIFVIPNIIREHGEEKARSNRESK